jgi:hypothetical protein
MTSEISVGELARQVHDALGRLQLLAERLDNTYVTKEVHRLYQQVTDQNLTNMRRIAENSASKRDLDSLKIEVGLKASIAEVVDLKSEKADKTVVEAVVQRVVSLEDNQKWLVRAVILMVIVAVVSTALVATGAPA